MSFLDKIRDRISNYGKTKEEIPLAPLNITSLRDEPIDIEDLKDIATKGLKITAGNGVTLRIFTNENNVPFNSNENYLKFIPIYIHPDNMDRVFEESPLFVLSYKNEEVMFHLGDKFGFISDSTGNKIKSINAIEGLEEIMDWSSGFSNKMFDYFTVDQRTKVMSENAFYKHGVPLERINTDFINTEMAMISVKNGEKLSDVPYRQRTYQVCLEAMKAIKEHPERVDNVDYIPNEFLNKTMIATGLENNMPISVIMPFLQNKKLYEYLGELNHTNMSEIKSFFIDHNPKNNNAFNADDFFLIQGLLDRDNNSIVDWQNNNNFIPGIIESFDTMAAHKEIKTINRPTLPKLGM